MEEKKVLFHGKNETFDLIEDIINAVNESVKSNDSESCKTYLTYLVMDLEKDAYRAGHEDALEEQNRKK